MAVNTIIDLEKELLLLTLQFYDNPLIPRNVVQCLFDTLNNFINNVYINYLQQEIKIHYKDFNTDILKRVNDSSKIIFEQFETEYKRFQLCQEKSLMNKPQSYVLGTRVIEKIDENGKKSVEQQEAHAVHIPLKQSLKLLLEIPGALNLLTKYADDLQSETNIISNFIQADLWKRKYKPVDGKFTIPLFVYEDEFETGNVLGSHAGKNTFGAIYTSIACFPQHILSQLNAILLTGLFYANDRKEFGNKKIFSKLISELNDLKKMG